MTVLDLGTLPPLPPLPDVLRDATVAICYARCPYCGGPLESLLSGCSLPGCRAAELDQDAHHTRLADA